MWLKGGLKKVFPGSVVVNLRGFFQNNYVSRNFTLFRHYAFISWRFSPLAKYELN